MRGVWKADVSMPGGDAKIVYDPNQCSVRQIVEAIESGGYTAALVQESGSAAIEPVTGGAHVHRRRPDVYEAAAGKGAEALDGLLLHRSRAVNSCRDRFHDYP